VIETNKKIVGGLKAEAMKLARLAVYLKAEVVELQMAECNEQAVARQGRLVGILEALLQFEGVV